MPRDLSVLIVAPAVILAMAACGDEEGSSDTDTEEEFVCTPATAEGTCSAIDECGCEPDWCKWLINPTGCTFFEGCTAGVTGTRGPGEECDASMIIPDPPWCRPGHICLQLGGATTGTCWELCRTAADCSTPGMSCIIPLDIGFPPDGHTCDPTTMTVPFQVCM